MKQILLEQLSELEWQPHPKIPGITSRFTSVDVSGHPAVDTLLARIEPGGMIPRHVHADTCELAYILSASGRLIEGDDDAQSRPLGQGSALFIPAGVPHGIENTSPEPMLIFAVHTVTKG